MHEYAPELILGSAEYLKIKFLKWSFIRHTHFSVLLFQCCSRFFSPTPLAFQNGRLLIEVLWGMNSQPGKKLCSKLRPLPSKSLVQVHVAFWWQIKPGKGDRIQGPPAPLIPSFTAPSAHHHPLPSLKHLPDFFCPVLLPMLLGAALTCSGTCSFGIWCWWDGTGFLLAQPTYALSQCVLFHVCFSPYRWSVWSIGTVGN